MANYRVTLIEKVTTVIQAETEEDAVFWAQTHTGGDVFREGASYDCEFSEDVEPTEEAASLII